MLSNRISALWLAVVYIVSHEECRYTVVVGPMTGEQRWALVLAG